MGTARAPRDSLSAVFVGLGTAVNVVAVVVGSGIGVLAGHRLPERTRDLVTTILGLFTVVIGGRAIVSGIFDALAAQVGSHARLLMVLGALLIGGVLGPASGRCRSSARCPTDSARAPSSFWSRRSWTASQRSRSRACSGSG